MLCVNISISVNIYIYVIFGNQCVYITCKYMGIYIFVNMFVKHFVSFQSSFALKLYKLPNYFFNLSTQESEHFCNSVRILKALQKRLKEIQRVGIAIRGREEKQSINNALTQRQNAVCVRQNSRIFQGRCETLHWLPVANRNTQEMILSWSVVPQNVSGSSMFLNRASQVNDHCALQHMGTCWSRVAVQRSAHIDPSLVLECLLWSIFHSKLEYI